MKSSSKIELSKLLNGFPTFPFAGELTVPMIEYRGIIIREGMKAQYQDEKPFVIEAIRLNPTIRFWTGSEWVIASSCKLLVKA